MNCPKSISGLWRGTYFFDRAEQRPSDGSGVGFELLLTQSWFQRLFGAFSGTVTDDPARGMSGTGTIHGRQSKASIRFTKRMPMVQFSNSSQTLTLQQLLERHGFALRAPRILHPSILYTGTFTDESTAAGTWLIEEGLIHVASHLSIPIPRGTGTFTLIR